MLIGMAFLMAVITPQVERSMSSLSTHGGRLDAAAGMFPKATLPWLDLSTGINPRPFTMPGTCVDHRALPSRSGLAELEAAAAAAFGLTGAIAAVPGTEIALRLLDTLGLSAPTVTVQPAYGTHAEALPGARGAAIDDLMEVSAGTVLLANPNNPDGRLTAPDQLLAFARSLGARGGCLVVDEAFADAHEDASILPLLGKNDPVLVLRSFGKFYGLGGVRLGFVCGWRKMVDRLRLRFGDWPVSSAAISFGIAAYRDTAWQRSTRDWLANAAQALDEVLRCYGLHPSGASPLFRLIDTPDAAGLFNHLARRGILTRPFDYAPTWLRVGLPADAAALLRLDRTLADR